jgi:Flp pilus assembly pilin Flp
LTRGEDELSAWSPSASSSGQEARQRQAPVFGQIGQGLVEYGLILVIVAVACVISLLFFGDQLASLLSLIASAV